MLDVQSPREQYRCKCWRTKEVTSMGVRRGGGVCDQTQCDLFLLWPAAISLPGTLPLIQRSGALE